MPIEPFTWTCPYCGRHTTIGSLNYDCHVDEYDVAKGQNQFSFGAEMIQCPNVDCGNISLKATIYENGWVTYNTGKRWEAVTELQAWQLMPRSKAKPLPDYVPKEVRDNYLEASLILADSPKASAAMSRRCLQGIIRDFWQIPNNKRGNLGAEINYISDKVDEDTLASIKAVREVGDIGAHMEKSVDTIVDVEPEEAELLVELVETLISDWYIARHRRNERNSQLQKVVASKREAKKSSKTGKALEDKAPEGD